MSGTFAVENAALFYQMADEVTAFHGATTLLRTGLKEVVS